MIFGHFSLSRQTALWLFIQYYGSSELSINTTRDKQLKRQGPNDKNQLSMQFEPALNGRCSAYGIG